MALPHVDVEALLVDARAGSKAALGEVLERHRVILETRARRQMGAKLIVKIGEAAVAQETMVIALEKFADFHGTSQKQFLSWLLRILFHLLEDLRKQFHRRKRDMRREIPLTDAVAESLLAEEDDDWEAWAYRRRELGEFVNDTYWQLPDEYQKVIMHRHFEGMTFAEIAVAMERSAGAAKKLWYRAFRLWRQNTQALRQQRKSNEDKRRPTSRQEGRP